jgi:hypothetical protein
VPTPEPSYEELAAFVVELTARLERADARLEQADARIEALEAEVAALRAQLGRNSTNSSTPPSADRWRRGGSGSRPGRSGCAPRIVSGVGSLVGRGRA